MKGGAGPPKENPCLPAAELLAPAPDVGWLPAAVPPAPKENARLPAAELVLAPTVGWLPAAELPAPKEKPWLPLAPPKPNMGAPADAWASADELAFAPNRAELPAEALLPPPRESAGLPGAALAVPKLNGGLLGTEKEVGLLAWVPSPEPDGKLDSLPAAELAAWLAAAELPPDPNRGGPEAAWSPAAEVLLPPKLNRGAPEAVWPPAAELPAMPNRGAPEAA